MTPARILIALGGAIVLAAINFSLVAKESIKRRGEVIYLDLTPVDPRSLMQGDYMVLRFRLAAEIESSWAGGRPYEGEVRLAPIVLDAKRIASLARPGARPDLQVRYRVRKGSPWLGTNAFFFQEGSDKRFANARYGEFRLDAASGEAVLVGLRNAKLEPL